MLERQLALASVPASCGEAREPTHKRPRRFPEIFVLRGFQRAVERQQQMQSQAMCLIVVCFMTSLAR